MLAWLAAGCLFSYTDSCDAQLPSAFDSANRPNIIVILADDLGYSDIGCTGSEIETPNLDRLARDGILFTNCYNTSRCCPSRAALLTGQYQWDAGLGHMISTRSPYPEYQTSMNRDNITIPEALRPQGYQTVMSGKWHIGNARRDWPDRRGFQSFYGTPTGGGLYFYPSRFYDRPIFRNGVEVTPDADWYSTDAFTDFAIEFLRNRKTSSPPFFMYLAYIAPHFPLQAKSKDISKYEGRYQVGYESTRTARFVRQQRMGIVPESTNPSGCVCPDWEKVDKKIEARKMAVYAAQIDCLDQNVGRIIETLKDTKSFQNTVVMFLSDNGGCSNSFNKTPAEEIGSRDSNAAYGVWYNVSNTPYRMAKSQEHEGGIITPLIVSWPKGLANPGTLNRTPVHIMDILPTTLELSQTPIPHEIKGRKLDPIDGVSFAGALRGEKLNEDRT
ncbi:MAG: arylsulfatase, partial [Planctomycetota bacterium]